MSTKNTTTIESYLPVFQGFYNTIFEYDSEENDIEEGKTYDDYTFDYADYHKRIAEACCKPIQEQLVDFGIKVKFQSLYSPKQYNFSNDSINVEYSLQSNSFELILDYLNENKTEFTQHLKDNFTSYDGFMSFYSNDVDVWFNEYLKEDNEKMSTLLGSLLEFILKNEEFTASELFEEVCDESYINFELKENA